MGLTSWVASANDPGSDFPNSEFALRGLSAPSSGNRIGVAIGDQILDLYCCAQRRVCSMGWTDAESSMQLHPNPTSSIR